MFPYLSMFSLKEYKQARMHACISNVGIYCCYYSAHIHAGHYTCICMNPTAAQDLSTRITTTSNKRNTPHQLHSVNYIATTTEFLSALLISNVQLITQQQQHDCCMHAMLIVVNSLAIVTTCSP